jgi:hypothetical protein
MNTIDDPDGRDTSPERWYRLSRILARSCPGCIEPVSTAV